MDKSTRGATIATMVAVTVVAAYVFLTLMFVTPPHPVKVAFAEVTDAATPFFAQRWNIFAPNISRSNPQLRVQAQWRDEDGELVESDWTSITAVEFAAVSGNPVPSRIGNLSWSALSVYLSHFQNLDSDQRAVVQDTFIERFEGEFRGMSPDHLIDRLASPSDNRDQVIDLLRYDFLIKEYATYFATATFDRPIERIRWEVYRERPNDFERRFDASFEYAPSTTQFGWRQADDRLRPDALATFEDIIARYGAES